MRRKNYGKISQYGSIFGQPSGGVQSQVDALNSSLAKLYPIGSIYLSVNSTNPSTFIGGTWERLKDRFLLAAGDSYAAGSTGGEASHTLSWGEMPSHRHSLLKENGRSEGDQTPGMSHATPERFTAHADAIRDNKYYWQSYTEFEGGNKPHNNMPPYLAVYMWVRTA